MIRPVVFPEKNIYLTTVLRYYNITGMYQTIYFRKKVWKKLQSNPNKSKFINELLEKLYDL